MTVDPRQRRVREEVSHHIDALREVLIAEGLTPEEADAEARRRFGDASEVERSTLEAGKRRGASSAGAPREIVQTLRGLRRAPLFSLSVVATLTLVMGAVVAMFGVLWDTLVRPLDLDDPDSLVVLVERMPEDGVEASPTSAGTFQDWRRDLREVTDAAAWEWVSRTFEDPERPIELLAVQVSGSLFELLGVQPILGRNLTEADEIVGGPATTLMISDDLWRERFGGDPTVIGRTITVEGVGREIVGVVPSRPEIWGGTPGLVEPSPHLPDEGTDNRGVRILNVVARLSPGATVDHASEEVASSVEQIALQNPNSARGWTGAAIGIEEYLIGGSRGPLRTAGIAVLILLVIAMVNVANLVATRAADRHRETALRAALGAGRGRLTRVRMIESLLLALSSGALSLGLALGIQRWVESTQSDLLPRPLGSVLSPTTLLFTLGLSIVIGVAVGGAVGFWESRVAVTGPGRSAVGGGGRRLGPVRRWMVVAQFGMTMVLLMGAGLLVRTVVAVSSVDLGFVSEGVVAARMNVDGVRYADEAVELRYLQDVVREVSRIPGVEVAGVTSALPMDPISANFDLPTRTAPEVSFGEADQVDFRMVGPGLMEALDFRLLDGRAFTDQDDRSSPLVAVVNRSLAELFWPGEGAVGKRIQNVWRSDTFAEVVGVVEDTRFYGPTQVSKPELFYPVAQTGWSFMTVVAKGVSGSEPLRAIEQAIVSVDPLLPPLDVFPVGELVVNSTSRERFYASLLGGFALLALLLAGAGIYGVVGYSVRMQQREYGVRLALGATRGEVTSRIFKGVLILAAIGITVGWIVAVPATELLSGMLFGVDRFDVGTVVGVAGLLTVVAVLACALPAMRAGRLDPAEVLRES